MQIAQNILLEIEHLNIFFGFKNQFNNFEKKQRR